MYDESSDESSCDYKNYTLDDLFSPPALKQRRLSKMLSKFREYDTKDACVQPKELSKCSFDFRVCLINSVQKHYFAFRRNVWTILSLLDWCIVEWEGEDSLQCFSRRSISTADGEDTHFQPEEKVLAIHGVRPYKHQELLFQVSQFILSTWSFFSQTLVR